MRLSVAPDEPAGVALGLKLPSYFYAKNSMIVAVDMLEARSAVPPYLLAALRVLFALR